MLTDSLPILSGKNASHQANFTTLIESTLSRMRPAPFMKNPLTVTDSDEFVLDNMPHFIAMNYQRLLAAQSPRERVELALHIYNLSLRILTISLVSQYLIRDKDRVSDPYLNQLLLQKFPHLTLDAWHQLLFTTLRAYEGNQDLFFMPELYDFYWDTSTLPHRRRVEVERPFERLTQLAVERQVERLSLQSNAAWEQLAADTMRLLQQVLHHLTFFSRYDLIRVLNYEGQFYEFELHKGVTISTERLPLSSYIDFGIGYFYFRREIQEFLPLHPLVLFFEGESRDNQLIYSEAAIYDRFIYEKLQYMLVFSGEKLLYDQSVKAFENLLVTINKVKLLRLVANKLTWWQLRELCADITQQRMSTAQHKYRPTLYLQRDKTSRAFKQFLDSDKRCFVLIGNSGVGKSNFLLALGKELQQLRSDLCVLMYDGAHFNMVSSVTEIISQDFDNRLALSDQSIDHIWSKIDQIDGIEQRRVILCVDAINESQQAKELLRQLDDLVQSPWPWLKVVFSSRPETWQAIKRGVRLSEALYYREVGVETVDVELESYSYSEQMEPFSHEELPLAYAKYRQVFELATPYEILSPTLREMLRAPLNLWLVAKTYAGQAIPTALKATDLIAQYVGALLRTERLREADLQLLEKQLAPLMVSQGRYHSVITVADIDAAGGGLYEAIYSEQLLSNGQRLNQSFTNLLDSDILAWQREGREQRIIFKYDHFYGYFIGRRIFELSKMEADRPTFFRDIVNKTTKSPLLWGALKNALIQDLTKNGPEVVSKFCFTDQQKVREMMVTILVDFGRDDQTQVEDILKNLLLSTRKVGLLHRLSQLFGKTTAVMDIPTHNAVRIAIEVASRLGIFWILEIAATQADSTAGTYTVDLPESTVTGRRNNVQFNFTGYNLRNIRSLLNNGFTDAELRRLCFDEPAFKPVYDQLAQETDKAKIIDRLLEYAERKLLLDYLLTLVKELNPTRYEKHQPYQ